MEARSAFLQWAGGLKENSGGSVCTRTDYVKKIGPSVIEAALALPTSEVLLFLAGASAAADFQGNRSRGGADAIGTSSGGTLEGGASASAADEGPSALSVAALLARGREHAAQQQGDGGDGFGAATLCKHCKLSTPLKLLQGGLCVRCFSNSGFAAPGEGSLSTLDVVRIVSYPDGVFTASGTERRVSAFCFNPAVVSLACVHTSSACLSDMCGVLQATP